MLRNELCTVALSTCWPSDEYLAYTIESATSKYIRKNCLSQIKCADLDNEAKTTRKVHNLSVNFVDATRCRR